ncbi:unnamed protein product [Dicrocoelium dendriticum]|nr:unnamed protein product [Dicrocoelium dendriticum]
MENFRDLQKKSKLLIEAEHRNFHDIWVMNEEALKKLANRLLEAHRVINEQQLGIPWIRPDTSFMCNVGPLTGPVDLSSRKPPAVIAIQHAFRTETSPLRAGDQTGPNVIPTSLRDVSPEVVRDFLQLLCYEPEFLFEEKLKRLFKPLSHEEETLMRLDTILTAIGVTNEEELDYLFTHFIVSAENSPITQKLQRPTKVIRRIELAHPQAAAEQESVNTETQPIISRDVVDPEGQFYSEEDRGTTFASTDAAVAVDVPDDNDEDANERKAALGEIDENTSKHISARTGRTSDITGDPLDSKPVSLWCHPKDEEAQPESLSDMTEVTAFQTDEDKKKKAWSLISPANVVNALNQFMENMQSQEVAHCTGALKSKHKESEKEGLKLTQSDTRFSLYGSKPHDSSTSYRNVSPGGVEPEKRDDSHDTEHWQKYATRIVSSETEKVWDNLCVGLERYLRILKHRAKMIHESEVLKRQNEELRHLLQQYLKAPVNSDLQLPPATTMRLE